MNIPALRFIQLIAMLEYVQSLHLNLKMSSKLIVGLNKYSHDTSCCVIEASTGKILFAQAKERITRKKHDGGGTGEILKYALEYLSATLDDVDVVVSNNHHYRVEPFEKRLPFATSLKYVSKDYLDEYNLVPKAQHYELSHHLAHAYSVASTAPFEEGLVLCMDGMGESYRAMMEDVLESPPSSSSSNNIPKYMNDIRVLKSLQEDELQRFSGVPRNLVPGAGYREAESAYLLTKSAIDGSRRLVPVFKRWCRERSPPELYNHGFENMDSMGAMYSRISSHVLGDWNACGKIMGLAPWDGKTRQQLKQWRNDDASQIDLGTKFHHKVKLMSGNPYQDGNSGEAFQVHWDTIEQLTHPNEWSESRFSELSNLAASVQLDLETCGLKLVDSLYTSTMKDMKSKNLMLVGGVALNSVLNSKLTLGGNSETAAAAVAAVAAVFDDVYVPPAPGDEGIAIGCALYGLQKWREKQSTSSTNTPSYPLLVPDIDPTSISAYSGTHYIDEVIELSLFEYTPWLETVTKHESSEDLIRSASEFLSQGEVIGWFQGRSEFGQRALGSRSILGDPRSNTIRHRINNDIKEREWYRPLAPAVLDDHTSVWFDIPNKNISPYMSITAQVKSEKVNEVPAICHIDNSARLQTVTSTDNSFFYQLITAFYQLTKIPMVLNTSFNRKSEPIVESPRDAIRSFLGMKGHLKRLYIGNFEVQYKPFEKAYTGPNSLVFAQPIYLAEVTTVPGKEEAPVRIRIQDGDEASENPSDEPEWKTLPSSLHLEILQLLQTNNNAMSEGGDDESDAQPGISVKELREILYEVSNQHIEDQTSDDEKKWNLSFDNALKYLYENTLLYFENVE